MSIEKEKLGENPKKVLRALVEGSNKNATYSYIESQTRLPKDEVRDAVVRLVGSNKLSVNYRSNHMAEYTLAEGTHERAASIVWRAINENGPMSAEELKEVTGMSDDEVAAAVDWLEREDYTDFTAMLYSHNPT